MVLLKIPNIANKLLGWDWKSSFLNVNYEHFKLLDTAVIKLRFVLENAYDTAKLQTTKTVVSSRHGNVADERSRWATTTIASESQSRQCRNSALPHPLLSRWLTHSWHRQCREFESHTGRFRVLLCVTFKACIPFRAHVKTETVVVQQTSLYRVLAAVKLPTHFISLWFPVVLFALIVLFV